jgi:hypothetical protein
LIVKEEKDEFETAMRKRRIGVVADFDRKKEIRLW